MSAPTPTARLAPPGTKLEDPFPTTVAISGSANINLWELSVKPPGVDGGDGIDTSTMFNTVYHTMSPRVLKKITDCTGKHAYDPAVLPDIVAVINQPRSITVHFSTGQTWTFWGYLKSFTPSDNARVGSMPEADTVFVVTNEDPTTKTEEAPIYQAASGTGTGV